MPGSLAAWLLDTTEAFLEAGIPSPRHDAQTLAAAAMNVSWGELWTRLRNAIPPEASARLNEYRARRLRREPLAYIVGSTEFYGLELLCGPEALVPRPETEVVVDVVLELIEDMDDAVVADIGTGTGAIAISIAVEREDCRVIATDVSADALVLAAQNDALHASQLELYRGDLFEALPPQMRGEFDVLVSNPPYIADASPDVQPELAFEPQHALFAGPAGDEILHRLVAQAPAWLRPTGVLVLEIGTDEQAERILDLMRDWSERGLVEDETDRPRVVWGRP